MSNECRCGRLTRDERSFCDKCADDLTQALAEMPWTVEQLDVTRTGEKAAASSGSFAPSAEKPLPIHLGALDAHRTLRAVLVSWVRFCDDEHVRGGRPGLPADTLPAMAGWLMHRVDGLALLEIGAEAVDEITDAVAVAHRLIDNPPERQYMGECDECGQRIWARADRDTGSCHNCGQEFVVAEKRAVVAEVAESQMDDRLYTASEMGVVLCAFGHGDDPVALADKIRKWGSPTKHSGVERPAKLIVRAHLRRDGQRARPAYRYGDALALLREAQERRRKRVA